MHAKHFDIDTPVNGTGDGICSQWSLGSFRQLSVFEGLKSDMKILVIDDEQVMIETLKRGLRSKGYQVVGASDCFTALYKLRTSKGIELVISDYLMPGMNGLALLKKIRAINASLPVGIMTAYGEKEILVECLNHQIDFYIDKPFSIAALIKKIENVKIKSAPMI